VTDQERQKAEEMISRLELSVGQVFPRDGGNAALIASMIQTLNGLRSLARPSPPPRSSEFTQRFWRSGPRAGGVRKHPGPGGRQRPVASSALM
jgi:hypothetical protein